MKADKPPRFLSIEFHTRFFPSFLWGRLRPKQRTGSGFNSYLERYLSLTVCIILVAVGFPPALSHGSIAGWIASGIGTAGFLAVIINSIASSWGETPSYDDFLAGFFFFFLTAGLTAGIFVGTLQQSLALGLLVSAAGLLAGYLLGIFAGLWFQYLGWIIVLLDGLAGLAIIGMIVVDLVLLLG